MGHEAATYTDWFGKSRREREKDAAIEREKLKKEKEKEAAAAKESAKLASSSSSRPSASQSSTSTAGKISSYSSTSSKSTIPRVPMKTQPSPLSGARPSAASGSKSPHPLTTSRLPPPLPSSSSYSNGATSSAAKKRMYDGDRSPDELAAKRRKHGTAAMQRRLVAQPDYDEDRDSYDSGFDSDEVDDVRPSGYKPGYIASLMGRNIERDALREAALSDSENSDDDAKGRTARAKRKSYGYDELMREEARSVRLARKEDEEEERRLKEHEEMKRRKKELKRKEAASARA